jgi:hypothetical protein
MEYPNVYHSVKSTHEYVEQYVAEGRSGAVPGFTTSSKTRPLIVAKFEEFVRNKVITLYSSRVINEIRTFVWNSGRPQAMRGYNDDLVMSLAIACWIRDTVVTSSKRDMKYTKAMLDSILVANTKINTTIPGMSGYKRSETHDKMSEQAKLQKEFSWLYKG